MSLRITADQVYKRSLIDNKIDDYVKEFLSAISELIEKASCNNVEHVIYEVPSILTDIHINPVEIHKIICYRLVRSIVDAKYNVCITTTKDRKYLIKISWKLAYNKKKMCLIDEFLNQYRN